MCSVCKLPQRGRFPFAPGRPLVARCCAARPCRGGDCGQGAVSSWGASGGSGEHVLLTFDLYLVRDGRVSGTVNPTRFLNLDLKQVGLTAGENHLFQALNRLSAIRKKEKQ